MSHHYAAIHPNKDRVKCIVIPILLAAAVDIATAQTIPDVQPVAAVRPAAIPQDNSSTCRSRLTEEVAIAPSIPPLDGPGECAVGGMVRLEAVVLPDGSRVAIAPPAKIRCDMAEALVRWVREDVVAAVEGLGAPLRSIDNYASYQCRSRNNISGAPLSEHGRANALDIRSLKLANGKVVGLTDPHTARNVREHLRKSACARFSTVLGPGSDGYHEDHIHIDLQRRARGRFPMCRWNVRGQE